MKIFFLLIPLILISSCKNNSEKSVIEGSNTIEVIKVDDSTGVHIVLGSEAFDTDEAYKLNLSGIEFIKKGKYKKAEEKFIAAYRIEPENPIILNNLGNIYREIGTSKMALEYYNESFIASDSTYFIAGYNMGIAYCNLGEYEKSLAILERVIEDTGDENRKMIAEYVIVRVYLSQNDCNKAKKLYEKIEPKLDNFPEFNKNRDKLEKRIKNCVQHWL